MQIRVRNSLEFWKSTPTTAAVLFGLEMPYRPPKSTFGALLWRRRVWLETTTGLSLLEPWEKVLILAIFYFLLLLLITGVYKLLPGQLEAVQHRMVYYFFGQEADKPGVYVQRFVAGLLSSSSAREL